MAPQPVSPPNAALALAVIASSTARNSMAEQRIQTMKSWADYLDELRSGVIGMEATS